MSEYPFHNICMQPTHTCDICEKNCNSCRLVYYGRLEAVVLCSDNECKKNITKQIINYINSSKSIPLFALYEKKQDVLFYRKSHILYNLKPSELMCETQVFSDNDLILFYNRVLSHNEYLNLD